MQEIIKELKELGYEGKISEGAMGTSNYAWIQFPKKGNSKLIKDLKANGWEKDREWKNASMFDRIYEGYSMYISFKKFY
ncbi:MAG: hypothetical protein ACFFG0_41685 [Candidatus Thorarchaeota archaeon]